MSEENTNTTTTTTTTNNNNNNTQSESSKQEDTRVPLDDCIATLESAQGPLEELSQEAAEWFDEAENKIIDTADLLRQKFQTIRDAIDKKEKEMTEFLEEYDADLKAMQELIDNAHNLALEVPDILESGKALLNRNNEEGKEEEDILSIKEKVKCSEDIVRKLSLLKKCRVCANTEGFLRGVNRKLKEIGEIKDVEMKRVLCSAPTGLAVKRVSSVFAILQWDESDDLSDYTVQKREEGCEWDDDDDDDRGNLIHVTRRRGTVVLCTP